MVVPVVQLWTAVAAAQEKTRKSDNMLITMIEKTFCESRKDTIVQPEFDPQSVDIHVQNAGIPEVIQLIAAGRVG